MSQMSKNGLPTLENRLEHLAIDLFLFRGHSSGCLPLGSGAGISHRFTHYLPHPLIYELIQGVVFALQSILEDLGLHAEGVLNLGELSLQLRQIGAHLLVKVLIQRLELCGLSLPSERVGQIHLSTLAQVLNATKIHRRDTI